MANLKGRELANLVTDTLADMITAAAHTRIDRIRRTPSLPYSSCSRAGSKRGRSAVLCLPQCALEELDSVPCPTCRPHHGARADYCDRRGTAELDARVVGGGGPGATAGPRRAWQPARQPGPPDRGAQRR